MRPLKTSVTASYLTAFAIVLLIFALAVHFAFSLELRFETTSRVGVLIEGAKEAVELKHGRVKIDDDSIQISAPANETVVWYDAAGSKLDLIGSPHLLQTAAGNLALLRVAAPVVKPGAPGAPASIVAAVGLGPSESTLGRVDLGLLIGLVVSLVAAGIGGSILANRALERVVATVRAQRDFTADAAHELRGPLAALSSNAAASLRDPANLTPQHRKRFETIAATASAMGRTVEDLLLLARAETPLGRELFAVDIAERITGVVDSRRSLAQERRISLELRSCPARVYGNPAEIDRIFGNLLDNALRYTPAGGSVAVDCASERSGVTLRVKDTGIGISPFDIPRIFDRFWRADAVRSREGGTGLGLAIARALARRHGGDVRAESRPDQGSEFSVWLPVRPPRTAGVFSSLT